MGRWSWRSSDGKSQTEQVRANEIKAVNRQRIARAEKEAAARRQEGGRTIDKHGRSDRK